MKARYAGWAGLLLAAALLLAPTRSAAQFERGTERIPGRRSIERITSRSASQADRATERVRAAQAAQVVQVAQVTEAARRIQAAQQIQAAQRKARYELHDGEILYRLGEAAAPLSTNAVLADGTVIQARSGTVRYPDGRQVTLREGDYVQANGSIVRALPTSVAAPAEDPIEPGEYAPYLDPAGAPTAVASRGFAWPPLPYSETMDLPSIFFTNIHTLGEAADHLYRVLWNADYTEYKYYVLPNQPGFAVVTKYEQITDDCLPMAEPDRWSLNTSMCPDFSLLCLAKHALLPVTGRWRVFVFVVTDRPLPPPQGADPTTNQALVWFGRGSNRLPADVRTRAFTADHYGAVLVYEFEKKQGQEVALLTSSRYRSLYHLSKARLLP